MLRSSFSGQLAVEITIAALVATVNLTAIEAAEIDAGSGGSSVIFGDLTGSGLSATGLFFDRRGRRRRGGRAPLRPVDRRDRR